MDDDYPYMVASGSRQRLDSDPADGGGKNTKKRKLDRACDACRRRKTKCDGPKMRDNVCTNCIHSRKECTYMETSKPRSPPKAYVTGLEDRMRKMEDLLQRLYPDKDFSQELGPPVAIGSWKDADDGDELHDATASIPARPPIKPSLDALLSSKRPLPFSSHLMLDPAPKTGTPKPDSHTSSATTSDDEGDPLEDEHGKGTYDLRAIQRITNTPNNHTRWHGNSTSLNLMNATRRVKQMHFAESSDSSTAMSDSDSWRRSEVWRPPPWELVYEGLHPSSKDNCLTSLTIVPPPDLCRSLIDSYFRHSDSHFPLIHRPSFERHFANQLHERNHWYRSLLLAICAMGSRWSNDQRVLPRIPHTNDDGSEDWSSAGLDYFAASLDIHHARRSLLYPATLYEIQALAVLALYVRGQSQESTVRTLATGALRKIQDVGAHRAVVYQPEPSVVEEQWKRVFWFFMGIDRLCAATMGRSCSIGEEDYDVPLPLEVDVEYWESDDPALRFRQPAHIPSTVTAFNLWLKLTQITAFAIRTIYAPDSSKPIVGRPVGKPEQLVSQLSAALTEWAHSVPDNLKWTGTNTDPKWSNISAMLYTSYYLVQMLVYRPYIPAPMSPTPSTLPFSSLAICTHAAQCTAKIFAVQVPKFGFDNAPLLSAACGLSLGVLLVQFWQGKLKGEGSFADIAEDVAIFVDALEWLKRNYMSARELLAQVTQVMPSSEDILDSVTPSSSVGPTPTTATPPPSSAYGWTSGPEYPPSDAPIGGNTRQYPTDHHRSRTYSAPTREAFTPMAHLPPQHPGALTTLYQGDRSYDGRYSADTRSRTLEEWPMRRLSRTSSYETMPYHASSSTAALYPDPRQYQADKGYYGSVEGQQLYTMAAEGPDVEAEERSSYPRHRPDTSRWEGASQYGYEQRLSRDVGFPPPPPPPPQIGYGGGGTGGWQQYPGALEERFPQPPPPEWEQEPRTYGSQYHS